MIRVAYVVYYQDNVKKIVPIEEIKDLRPPKNETDFDKDHLYQVYWANKENDDGEYYPAKILKLGESEEKMKTELNKKRVSQTTVVVKSLPIADSSKKLAKHHDKAKKTHSQNTMAKILKQKIESRKTNGLFATKRQNPSTDEEVMESEVEESANGDDDAPIVNNNTEVLQLKEQVKTLTDEKKLKDEAYKKFKLEVKKIFDDNDQLTVLNRRLQHELLSALEANSSRPMPGSKPANCASTATSSPPFKLQGRLHSNNTIPLYDGLLNTALFVNIHYKSNRTLLTYVSPVVDAEYESWNTPHRNSSQSTHSIGFERDDEEHDSPPPVIVETNANENQAGCSSSTQFTQLRKPQHSMPSPLISNCQARDMIDLGSNVKIHKDKWDDVINPGNNASMFCKKMAMAMWGEDVLAKRTVEGKIPNRKNNLHTTYKGLTPEKVALIKNQLRNRLKPKILDPQMLNKEVNMTTKYINEKCITLRRAQKPGSSDRRQSEEGGQELDHAD